jgi:hypothetical protein
LSQLREDYNLVLDAIALGYWVRECELEVVGDRYVLDESWKQPVRRHLDEDSTEALRTAMGQLGEALPDGFIAGPEVWDDVLDLSLDALEARGEQILTQEPEFDDDAEITPDHRSFCFRLGYGLAITVDALGLEGTQPRQ